MNNIIVDIEDDTVYCYKKDNSYTNQIINHYTDIIMDICNIISQYVNCIIIKMDINFIKREYLSSKSYTINAIREFIDFKPFIHCITIIHYLRTRLIKRFRRTKRIKCALGFWVFNNKYNKSTILYENICQYEYRVSDLDNLVKYYQKKKDESFIDPLNKEHRTVIYNPSKKEHRIIIYDPDLFLCLISIIYKIVNTQDVININNIILNE